MSEALSTLPVVRISEDQVADWLAAQGFRVVEFTHANVWGWTDLRRREVGLNRALLVRQRVPVLLHECEHVRRQDQGHQCQAVEDEIDETVALLLVNPGEYAFWEGQLGWSTGGIASALDLPRWVIEAYRRRLERAVYA